MVSVEFKDFSIKVKGVLNNKAVAWLEEVSGEIESQTKRNCAVVTGKTKGSFQHIVDESKLEAYVGSDYMNAVWEEFGTGLYAVNGDGRKTPWVYKDEHGVTHFTHGKKPKRMMHNAYHSNKNKLISRAKDVFGND